MRFGISDAEDEDKSYQASLAQPMVAQAVEVRVFARDVTMNYGEVGKESQIAIFTSTFSLSSFTTFDSILAKACHHWGLVRSNFAIYMVEGSQLKNLSDENQKVGRWLEDYH